MISALLVEDNLEFAEQLAAALDARGMVVTYCANAYEASVQITQQQFVYVVIDLMLPPSYKQEGLSVLREAVARQPTACTLLMTQRDRGMVSIVSDAMELGARYFFDKSDPLVLDKIMAKIATAEAERNNGIFISHGHNELLRLKLKDFVEHRLKRRPVVLAEQPSAGMTVVEKLERVSAECTFAVILMTRDDEVKGGGARARQNVIHELGFFQGKYGRRNVVLLVEEGLELFSNISGIVYIQFDPANFAEIFESLRLEISG